MPHPEKLLPGRLANTRWWTWQFPGNGARNPTQITQHPTMKTIFSVCWNTVCLCLCFSTFWFSTWFNSWPSCWRALWPKIGGLPTNALQPCGNSGFPPKKQNWRNANCSTPPQKNLNNKKSTWYGVTKKLAWGVHRFGKRYDGEFPKKKQHQDLSFRQTW